MNQHFIILITFTLFLNSCKQAAHDNQAKAEIAINDAYSRNFVTFSGDKIYADPIRLYQKIEEYYLFLDLLDSKNKSSYKRFFKNYIISDSIVDLDFLYANYPLTESLILPSNLTNNFYAFEQGINELKSVDKNLHLIQTYDALVELKSGMDLEIHDINKISDYLNSIQENDFKSKIIYRIPLIAISHVILSERDQLRKKSREK